MKNVCIWQNQKKMYKIFCLHMRSSTIILLANYYYHHNITHIQCKNVLCNILSLKKNSNNELLKFTILLINKFASELFIRKVYYYVLYNITNILKYLNNQINIELTEIFVCASLKLFQIFF